MNNYLPLLALLVCAGLIKLILSSRASAKLQDTPNDRSLHTTPVPRSGGIAILAGMLAGWSLYLPVITWWLLWPMLGLFVVSLIDDLRGLSVEKRLFAHLIAAAALVYGAGVWAQHGVIVSISLLLLTVWMTNLYNFMDGSDGLAGGMTLIGFSTLGLASLWVQSPTLFVLNFSVAAAAAGFLWFNFSPARIFMGDAASIPLGFLVAAMGVWGWQRLLWPFWFPMLAFAPFIVDATVTLIKRSLHGRKITEAHRDHYYQRLVRLGAGHGNTALLAYVLMLGSAGTALWLLKHPADMWPLLSAWGAIYAVLMLWLDQRWKERGGE
ncbi:MAG TPA: glycosyltransferase family 4 protein [Gallionellaceae bacterium]|nr:glycosyltransferase family 4 protein [Gallionellaceae bacterium]